VSFAVGSSHESSSEVESDSTSLTLACGSTLGSHYLLSGLIPFITFELSKLVSEAVGFKAH